MVKVSEKIFHFFVKVIVLCACSMSFVCSAEQIKILERSDVQKRIEVKKLFSKDNMRLRNYSTISLYVKNKLIFCHISNDKSEPKVICH